LRRVILAICATAAGLVLLLTFKTNTQPAASGPSPATSGPAPAASGSAADPGAAATVTGAAWPTIYGPVQVRVTVQAGRVTAVKVLQYPANTSRDVQINAFAIPQLNAETLAAGDAKIDTVSGATYTSQGYIGSLQNALDQAGRA
jgi:uncharacterized protein with FMN-binding domain